MGNQIQVFRMAIFILVIACLLCVDVSAITAKARISPAQGSTPLNVMFTDISEGSPIEWHWDFGDGYTGDGPRTMHTYMTPGTFTVTLLVLNAQGAADTAVFDRAITATANPFMPSIPMTVPSFSADFTGGPQNGPAPLAVSFSDMSKGEPTNWIWDFGDGTTSNEQNPVHLYSDIGTYSVTMKISRDTSTGMKERKNYITVNAGNPAGTSGTSMNNVGTQPMSVSTQDTPISSAKPSTGEEFSFQMYPETSEKACESGLSFQIAEKNVSLGEDFSIGMVGEPLEKVYVWLSISSDETFPDISRIPKIMNNDMVFDKIDGPYPIGLFIPDSSNGLSIRDLIPNNESEYSTGLYGVLALDKNGEQTILFGSKDSPAGNYLINAVLGEKGKDTRCIETLKVSIVSQ